MEIQKENQIRISYFRDFADPNRVICIARQFDKPNKKVAFAYSINHPTEWKIVLEGKKLKGKVSTILTKKQKEQKQDPKEFVVDGKNVVVLVREKGDAFSRARARLVAKNRLLDGFGTIISVPDEQKPIRACLEWLISMRIVDGQWIINEPNNKVRKLVENVLIDFDFPRIK